MQKDEAGTGNPQIDDQGQGQAGSLRPWSSLSADERTRLMTAYQPIADCAGPTCDFRVKLARMQDFLAEHGVSLDEAEIRAPRA